MEAFILIFTMTALGCEKPLKKVAGGGGRVFIYLGGGEGGRRRRREGGAFRGCWPRTRTPWEPIFYLIFSFRSVLHGTSVFHLLTERGWPLAPPPLAAVKAVKGREEEEEGGGGSMEGGAKEEEGEAEEDASFAWTGTSSSAPNSGQDSRRPEEEGYSKSHI